MLTYLDRAGAWVAKRFGQPINTSAAFILAAYTYIWGLWLLNPFWDVFGRAALFNWLSSIAPESFWGTIAVSVGIVMGYGLVKQTYKALIVGLFVGFTHWTLITFGYFIGDWQNTGGITSAMIAVYCAFVYLNLRMNKEYYIEAGILR